MNTFSPLKVNLYSILPSPYQRDLLYALSQHPKVDLQVNYLEPACADSPWPAKPIQSYERILPGFDVSWGLSRFHFNWHFPKIKDADVVVFNGYMSLTAQLLLRWQARQVPCVFWGETMAASSGGLKGKIQPILAQPLEKCKGIAGVGSQAVEDYQQRFPNKPIFNIPYYCNLSEFRNNIPQRPRTPPTILFCGQMIPRKGVDLLLQAFEQLLQQGLNAHLLLVGREAELSQMLETLAETTRQKIEYAGFQAPENLPYFFRQADLFVLPSRYDGWGVVVNQAVGAGLPVICSDAVGAARDLVEPNYNGLICSAGDVEALTNSIAYYLQTPEAIPMASKASQRKAEDWSPTVGAQRWVDAFEKVMNEK
jgi:glycosyltransferase involved in cell wall biosynthesis